MIRVEISSKISPTAKNALVSNYSKMVEQTIKVNERENELLRQQNKSIDNEHTLARISDKHEKIELQKDLVEIPKIKKTAPLSSERKLFLSKHGVMLGDNEKSYNINYFMSLMDKVTESMDAEGISVDGGLEEDEVLRSPRENPSKFPLRLDFSEEGARRRKLEREQEIEDRRDRERMNKKVTTIFGENPDSTTGHDTSENHPNREKPGTSGHTERYNNNNKEEDSEHNTTGHNNNNNAGHKKGKHKEKTHHPPNNTTERPRWMFRTIEPPEHGRRIWKKKQKFGGTNILPDEIEKPKVEKDVEKHNELQPEPVESKEDILLNEKADDYRFRILAQNKMSTMYIPATSFQKTPVKYTQQSVSKTKQ